MGYFGRRPSPAPLSFDDVSDGGSIVIDNAGTIGSVGDSDALTVASNGVVTFSQPVTVNGVSGLVDGDMPAGSIVQVVNATTTTEVTNATTSYVNTNLSASITPSSATNKILILFQQNYFLSRSDAFQGHALRLLRGGTEVTKWESTLVPIGAGYLQAGGATSAVLAGNFNSPVLDSPATTSSVTYTIQGKTYLTSSSGSVIYNWASTPSYITLLEVVA